MIAAPTVSQQYISVNVLVVAMDDPDYDLKIYMSGDWRGWRSHAVKKEPWTFDWLKGLHEGHVLYDVGACVGSYSLMAAARGVTIIAFEPVPWNYAECMANVYLNGFEDRITVIPKAAGPEDGLTIIRHPQGPVPGFGEGGVKQMWMQPVWNMRTPQVALRNLVPRPTHVKIDVEGAETQVLRGMSFDTVESLIVEVKDEDAEADVLGILQAHGFESTWSGGRRTENQRTHVFRRRE